MPIQQHLESLDLSGMTIVFDLDGTIADTAPDLIEAANAALVSEGFAAAPAAAIKSGVGYGTKAMLRAAFAAIEREVSEDQLQRLSKKLVAYYTDRIADKTVLFDGFLAAAGELRAAEAKLALCTNKKEYLARRLVSTLGIASLFDGVAGGDTFAFHKPDPRHITELIRMVGGDPSAAIMIGDSEADIAAASAAGVPSVAVSFGYAAIPAEKLGATAIIGHFNELIQTIAYLLPFERPV